MFSSQSHNQHKKLESLLQQEHAKRLGAQGTHPVKKMPLFKVRIAEKEVMGLRKQQYFLRLYKRKKQFVLCAARCIKRVLRIPLKGRR